MYAVNDLSTCSTWGKCQICGYNAVVAVELCFNRLKSNGTIYEPSHQRTMHSDHPLLCEQHRHVVGTFVRQLVIPSPPDSRGQVTIRYPFS